MNRRFIEDLEPAFILKSWNIDRAATPQMRSPEYLIANWESVNEYGKSIGPRKVPKLLVIEHEAKNIDKCEKAYSFRFNKFYNKRKEPIKGDK